MDCKEDRAFWRLALYPERFGKTACQHWISPQVLGELRKARTVNIGSVTGGAFRDLQRAQRFNIGSVADKFRTDPELIRGERWTPEISKSLSAVQGSPVGALQARELMKRNASQFSKLSRFPTPALNALTYKNEEVVRAARDIALSTKHIKEYLGPSYLSDFQRATDSISQKMADFSPKVVSFAQQIALQSSGLQNAMSQMASELSRMPTEQIRTQFADVLRQSTNLFSNPELQRAIGRIRSEDGLREVMENASEAGISLEEGVEEGDGLYPDLPETDWIYAAEALYPYVRKANLTLKIALAVVYSSAEFEELRIPVVTAFAWISVLEGLLEAVVNKEED